MIKLLILAGLIAVFFVYAKRFLSPVQVMSRSDAAKLLDLSIDANPEAIIAAHRRLIAKVHPDAGGSAELAARVNQARDILLKSLP